MQPMRSIHFIPLFLLLLLANPASAELTLKAAEQLAMEKDPAAARLLAESRSLAQKAIADGQLSDPRLTLGIASIPLDTWDLDQEAMTQEKIGITQGFPRGDTLRLKQEQTQSMSQEKRVAADLEHRKILQGVRMAFQEVIYQHQACQIVLDSQKFLKQLVEIVEFRYSSGRAARQDFLEASLTLAKTEDRLLKIKNQEDLARARLSQWIPREMAFGPLPATFPDLPPVPERNAMHDRLTRHPSIQMAEVMIHTQELNQLQAKEQYKPGWMVDVNYGIRQGDNPNKTPRTDFLSFMVSMDLPLFTGQRQDRTHQASQIQVEAAQLGRDDRLRSLKADLETHLADHLRLGERLQLFDARLLPEARQNTETTMISYQSNVADLTSVIRAHLAELTIRLDHLEVSYKRLMTQTKLLFIVGDVE